MAARAEIARPDTRKVAPAAKPAAADLPRTALAAARMRPAGTAPAAKRTNPVWRPAATAVRAVATPLAVQRPAARQPVATAMAAMLSEATAI